MSELARWERIAALRKQRPRAGLLHGSALALALLAVLAWTTGDFASSAPTAGGRLAELARFAHELVPHALRDRPLELGELGAWIAERWSTSGAAATATTLALAIAATALAALLALPASFLAARTLACAEPYVDDPRPASRVRRATWGLAQRLVRALLLLLRATPEYVLAFLAVALLGPLAWALVLGLALHNAGILGRLGAELAEDLPPRPAAALRASGATRTQIALLLLLPVAASRFVLLLFYRGETCLREATVLGMVALPSLGYGLAQARARLFYDEMLFFIACSALLVLAGDLFSTWIRARLSVARRGNCT
ncbi:MAG: ABC transporter permease subunit [Planctomycetes bacterium]|nr:ABC transporter permease subunit [Planctomycetota bacterium]